jgi:hypothetical protein
MRFGCVAAQVKRFGQMPFGGGEIALRLRNIGQADAALGNPERIGSIRRLALGKGFGN